jgi:cell division transport system permease protein
MTSRAFPDLSALTGKRAAAPERPSADLIPAETVDGRALVVLIAIMTFLACLTAGAAILIGEASQAWRNDIAHSVTIQIRAGPGEDGEALAAKVAEVARAAPGVEAAHALSSAETNALLEPWFGDSVDLSKLPMPRLITVTMKSGYENDLAGLRAALATASKEASLDDHAAWLKRLTAMANIVVTLAVAIFGLMIVSMATAIGFATRGAVANSRGIVEVLHFIGASDQFVAGQFQRHFLRLGSRGSLTGGGSAIACFLIASVMSWWWRNSPGGAETATLFGAFSLGVLGYLGLIAIAIGVALLTSHLSRWIVLNHLRDL